MFKFILNVAYYGIIAGVFLAITYVGWWSQKQMVKEAIREYQIETNKEQNHEGE